jgi:hypothetical protein
MVRALLDGRKTQTRRLASSPLRRVEVGDRLYVRERCWIWGNWRKDGMSKSGRQRWRFFPSGQKLSTFDPAHADIATKATPRESLAFWSRPSIHMPRWASRLTLIVEDVRFQRLQEISEKDAIDEGIEPGVHPDTGEFCGWRDYETIHTGPHKGANHPHAIIPYSEPWRSYASLWDELHREPGERWEDNPEIVALTFRVVRQNIDRIGDAR